MPLSQVTLVLLAIAAFALAGCTQGSDTGGDADGSGPTVCDGGGNGVAGDGGGTGPPGNGTSSTSGTASPPGNAGDGTTTETCPPT